MKLHLMIAVFLMMLSFNIFGQTPLTPLSITVNNVPSGQPLLGSQVELVVRLDEPVADPGLISATLDQMGAAQVRFLSDDKQTIAISFSIPNDARLVGSRDIRISIANAPKYKIALTIIGQVPILSYRTVEPKKLHINEGFQTVKVCGENLITLDFNSATLKDGANAGIAPTVAVLDNSFSVEGNCLSFNINPKGVLPAGTKLVIPYKTVGSNGVLDDAKMEFPFLEYVAVGQRFPKSFVIEPAAVYQDDDHLEQEISASLPAPVDKVKMFNISASADRGTGTLTFLTRSLQFNSGDQQIVFKIKDCSDPGFYEVTLENANDPTEKYKALLRVFEKPAIEKVTVVGKADLMVNINQEELIVIKGKGLRDINLALIEDPKNALIQFIKIGNLNHEEQVYRIDYTDKTKIRFRDYNLFPYRLSGPAKKFYSIQGNSKLTIHQVGEPIRDLRPTVELYNDKLVTDLSKTLNKWRDIKFRVDGQKFRYENGTQNFAFKALIYDEYGVLKREVFWEESGKRTYMIRHPTVPSENIGTSFNWNLSQAIGRSELKGFRRLTVEGYLVRTPENVYQERIYQQDFKIAPDNKEYIGLSISIPPFLWAASVGKRKITEGEGDNAKEKTDRYFQSQVLTINTGVGVKYRLTKDWLIPTNDYIAFYITGMNLGGEEVEAPADGSETESEPKVEKFIDQGSLAFLLMYEISLVNLDSGISIPLSLGLGAVPKSANDKFKGFFTIGFGIDIALGK